MNSFSADLDVRGKSVNSRNTLSIKNILHAKPDLNPYADGWYVIEFSKKVKSDRLISKKFLGEEVVIYRDSNTNEVVVVQAHCPHMGAHFDSYQNGGCVKDGILTCPYHLIQYDAQGKRVDIKSNSSRANLKKYKTLEHNGFVLALFQMDTTKPPISIDLEMPGIDPSEYVFTTQTLGKFRGDAMVPLMANADMNHFFSVHGTKVLRAIDAFEVSNNGRDAYFSFEADMSSEVDAGYPRGGRFMALRRKLSRPKPVPEHKLPKNTYVETFCRGPSLVMSHWVQNYMKIDALTWLYTTPMSPNEYEIFMVQAVKTLRQYKSKLMQRMINRVAVKAYAGLMDLFVGQEDPPFYSGLKIRLAQPVFTRNDEQLIKYQAWWKGLFPKEYQDITNAVNVDFS